MGLKKPYSSAISLRVAGDVFHLIYMLSLSFPLRAIQTDVESDTEEDESELESGFEEMKSDEDESEELQDPHSTKFRAEGQLLSYEEEPR